MSNTEIDQTEQPLFHHLMELRRCLIRALLGVSAVFVILVWFSNPLYTALAEPLTRNLPGAELIATGPIAPFMTPIKLSLALSFFVSIPWVLYHIWAFIAPGLYAREKKRVMPFVISSTVLFYVGMAFAYFVILPMFAWFIVQTAPEGVKVMPDISSYLDLVLGLFMAFGIAFEIPVATVLCIMAGIVSVKQIKKKRPYIFIIGLIIAALITPPDGFTMILLAIPMFLLFEAALWCGQLFENQQADPEANSAP